MKRTILPVALLAMTMCMSAQSEDVIVDNTDTNQVVDSLRPELMPQFPGGQAALMEFLSKNIKYPEQAVKYGVGGRVIMTFFVEKDGKVKNVSAMKCNVSQFNTRFDQEPLARQKELKKKFALQFAKEGARVIRKMPKWTPGQHKGECVRVRYNLPITFAMPK